MEQIVRRTEFVVEGQTRRFLFALSDRDLPLYVESIGFNPEQEPMVRRTGYPVFHWLQTLEGEGEFELSGRKFSLPAGNGALLFPGVPHAYAPKGKVWKTLYLTFGGSLADAILAALDIRHTEWFHWNEDAPVTEQLLAMVEQAEHDEDRTGLNASSQLYHFITVLKKYGQTGSRSSLFHHLEKLDPLLQWLDVHYGDPEIGLTDMAQQLEISPRYLNALFRQAFGITAYAYLIRLRIRKAKELMSRGERRSVKDIALACGYRDPSHFIAAFGKTENMTPDQFRKLHGWAT
ncbi:AraC-like DNA-binding protein [Paenibacillus phyllosphaerae]|uniref:AraC-like DNA-binding protein n=1 Tax=Paenibacillus phyllosphaerae TaxID=274593 RepID=A0A7W5FKS4_9BACL|nr:AraC family transcriptional regulator [Paenibacillus phyllosphaerae]MBB3108475.1 AraC-like DNA-binding protein [Paenibacillus phyllosphaerae]